MNKNGFVDEAKAYALLAQAGLRPPRHGIAGESLPFSASEPVVVKGLGENLWHKSEIGAVRFLPFGIDAVLDETNRMRPLVEADGHRWIAGLVCEQIAVARNGQLPSEGFVSLSFGETGATILCGFGGLSANALAELAPPLRWPVAFVSADDALREFEAHLLGRIWLGQVRGARPLTTRKQLAGFFTALWHLVDLAGREGLGLLELNPVALDQHGEPRPLDAVGSRRPVPLPRLGPPPGFLEALRAPRRIALAGVSAQEGGVGRTILDNLRACRLPAGDLVLVKPGQAELLGLPCVPDVAALLRAPVDLLILALPAPAAVVVLLQLLEQGGGSAAVALVCGGIGDGADTAGFGDQLTGALRVARAEGRWTPAVLGPNFLGHWVPSRRLDTSFIPADKLAPPAPTGGDLTLLSQSGAFLLSRRSRHPALRFGLGIALGNQLDAALCDVLAALAAENGRGPVAAYVEGFGPGQLLPAAHAIAQLHAQGRTVLIHRAGRTEAGQAAAASHTGAMAGDLALERTLLERAGAKFTDSIAAFDAALTWLSAWPSLTSGTVALMTNAGFESVNGSDLFGGRLAAARLDEQAEAALAGLLASHELSGLVTPQLPLDLTPMAGDQVFVAAADLLLDHAGMLVVGLVPFTRRLDTSPEGAVALARQLARLCMRHGKPVAIVIDAGRDYAGYQQAFRDAGLPVFDRTETALVGLRVLV